MGTRDEILEHVHRVMKRTYGKGVAFTIAHTESGAHDCVKARCIVKTKKPAAK